MYIFEICSLVLEDTNELEGTVEHMLEALNNIKNYAAAKGMIVSSCEKALIEQFQDILIVSGEKITESITLNDLKYIFPENCIKTKISDNNIVLNSRVFSFYKTLGGKKIYLQEVDLDNELNDINIKKDFYIDNAQLEIIKQSNYKYKIKKENNEDEEINLNNRTIAELDIENFKGYTVNFESDYPDLVTPSVGAVKLKKGQKIQFDAKNRNNILFLHWAVNDNQDEHNPLTITVNENLNVKAIFKEYLQKNEVDSSFNIHKYISKGREGYVVDFTNDFIGNDKGTFWISFVTFIKTASSNNEFKNILEFQEFWKYYQNDGFFIKKDQDALFSREYDDVVKVFDEAVKNYWKNILARMFRLEEINDKVEDVKKYTQNNDYENRLKSYITIYNELKSFNTPKGKVELYNFRYNFLKLLQAVGNVVDNIKRPILDYIDSWEDYFSIPIPRGAGNYLAKSEAYKKRKEKLEIIEPLAKEISLFNLSNQKGEINQRKKDWETNEKYYAIHFEIDNLIESFKNFPLPAAEEDIVGKWNELMEVKNKITKLRSLVKPEPELLEKIKEFESIPSENKMEALESYFINHRNSTNIIAKIVNAKFKKQLIQSLERLWDKGSLNTCQNIVKKYIEYFGICKYEAYFSFIERYDSMVDDFNKGKKGKIIELYCLAKNYTDYNLVQKKAKLTPLDTLKEDYNKYINEEAQKIFPKAPYGNERNKEDFNNFLNIYRKIKADIEDFSLDEPYASKFSVLYSYFYAKDENEKKRAEQDILKDPMLATAYGIKFSFEQYKSSKVDPFVKTEN